MQDLSDNSHVWMDESRTWYRDFVKLRPLQDGVRGEPERGAQEDQVGPGGTEGYNDVDDIGATFHQRRAGGHAEHVAFEATV